MPVTRVLPRPLWSFLSASLCAAAVIAFTPLHSHAQQGEPGRRDDATSWGLGLAVMPEIKPYRDFDDKTRVLPLLTFENRWVRVFGPGLEFKLGRSGPVSYGLTLGYAGDGYKASDSPFLAGMDKRRASAWVGGRLGLQAGWASFSAEASTDATSHSQGTKLRLGVERRVSLGSVGLTPRLTTTWLDRKFVDYYYGVRIGEATATRSAYAPGSTLNTELGLRVDYRLAPEQVLFADVGVVALGNAIKRSPLVDRSTLPEVRLGYLYRF